MAGVRIFKTGSQVEGVGAKKTLFEGVVSSFDTDWVDDYFWVTKNGFDAFRRHWENILDEAGNGFATKELAQAYLDVVFNKTENDFLAYYILNRDT